LSLQFCTNELSDAVSKHLISAFCEVTTDVAIDWRFDTATVASNVKDCDTLVPERCSLSGEMREILNNSGL